MKKHFTGVFVLLGFFVLISLFLDVRIYRDHTLLVGDSLYYQDPIFGSFGGVFFHSKPSNLLMDLDNNLFNYPFHHYTQNSLARGEIPWWNPYVGMGVPFVGLGSGVFDPLSALTGLLSPTTVWTNVLAVTGLFVAACGMFLFLGALGVSLSARIFGAVVFAFCGWTVVWLGRTNFMTGIWLPWLFWASELLLRRVHVRQIGLLALCTGMICLSGHLQTSFHVLAACSLYIFVRTLQMRSSSKGRMQVALACGLALALGIGIASVQIIPFADLVSQTTLPDQGRSIQLKADDPMTAVRYGLTGDWEFMKRMAPTSLTAISPLLFGSPQRGDFWWPVENFPEATLYLGLLPLFFALYGFTKIKELPHIRVWFILASLSLGVVYSLPAFNLVNYLPVFNQINNGRLRLIYCFAMSVAAAIGLDRFTAPSVQGSGRGRLWFAGGYVAAVVALPPVVLWMLSTTPLGRAIPVNVGTGGLWTWLESAQTPILAVLSVLGLLILAWRLGLVGNRAFRAAIILVAYADLYWIFHGYNPVIPRGFVFPRTEVIRFFDKDPSLFRVSSSSLRKLMPANMKLIYGIYDIDLFSLLTVGRYADVQSRITPSTFDAFRYFGFSSPASYRGLINLMNVKYFVVPLPNETGSRTADPFRLLDQYRLVYDREVRIYENLEALPRSFLVNRSSVLDAPSVILARLTRPDFDPMKAVLLEDWKSPRIPMGPSPGGAGEAEIVTLSSNRVVVHAHSTDSSYLVLSEMNYPGWKATVDGVEKPIYAAYYLFRSVYLDAGAHEIVFTFVPKRYAVAKTMSLSSLGLIVILFMVGFKKNWGLG